MAVFCSVRWQCYKPELKGIYRYFLEQATAIAKMAQMQLAFERQEVGPDLVQNPQQQKEVSFNTRREDFPPNVTDLKIEHFTLYIAGKSGTADEFDLDLKFFPLGSAGNIGGAASTVGGVAGTRQSNAGSWMTMKGKSPAGEWTLAFLDNQEIKDLFANDQIEDILLVITFGGRTPEWPQ